VKGRSACIRDPGGNIIGMGERDPHARMRSFDWTPVLSCTLAAILYLNTLKGHFVYDDR